jgi:hypothetical protein
MSLIKRLLMGSTGLLEERPGRAKMQQANGVGTFKATVRLLASFVNVLEQ